MGSCERRIVAYSVNALLRSYRVWTMVMFPAASVFGRMMPKFIVRLCKSAWSTPLCSWINQTTTWRLILSLYPRGSARLFQISHKIARHLSNPFGVCTEDHFLYNTPIRVQSTKRGISVQFHHSGHGGVRHENTTLSFITPKCWYQQQKYSKHIGKQFVVTLRFGY